MTELVTARELEWPEVDPPRAEPEPTNWGLILAIVILVAPTLFSLQSNLALPGPLKVNGAKGVEAIALGLFVCWMIRERWIPSFNLLMVLATFFLAYSAMSGLWAVDSVGFKQQIKKLVHVFANVLTLFIAIRTRRDLDNAMLAWKMLSFAVAAATFLEVYAPGFRVSATLEGREATVRMAQDIGVGTYYRAQGPMGHPNWLGYFLGTTMVLTPWAWVRFTSRRVRILLVIGFLLEGYALVAAHVRLGVLGLAVGVAWLIIRGAFKYRLLPVLVIAFGALLAWPFLPQSWKERTFGEEHLEESRSIKTRWSLLEEGLRLSLVHGGLGQGYGSFGWVFYNEARGFGIEKYLRDQNMFWRQNEARVDNLGGHNAYFEVLIELGMPGIFLFMAIGIVGYLGLFAAGYRNSRDPPARMMGLVLEASLAAMFVMNIVMHAQEQRCVWTWIGITAAYMSLTRHGLMADPGSSRFPAAAIKPLIIIGAVVWFLLLVSAVTS